MIDGHVFNSDYFFINEKEIWIITCDSWVAKVTLSSQLMFAQRMALSPWRPCPCDFAGVMQLQASQREINCWWAMLMQTALPWQTEPALKHKLNFSFLFQLHREDQGRGNRGELSGLSWGKHWVLLLEGSCSDWEEWSESSDLCENHAWMIIFIYRTYVWVIEGYWTLPVFLYELRLFSLPSTCSHSFMCNLVMSGKLHQ